MKKRRVFGGILMSISLAYALFNAKISGAAVGADLSPGILGLIFLGTFIGGLYLIISNNKD